MKSDAELNMQIRDEITALMGTRADDVHVQVLRGAVSLTGKLQSDSEKWALCDAIKGMPSVKRLTDDTTVLPDSSEDMSNINAVRPGRASD